MSCQTARPVVLCGAGHPDRRATSDGLLEMLVESAAPAEPAATMAAVAGAPAIRSRQGQCRPQYAELGDVDRFRRSRLFLHTGKVEQPRNGPNLLFRSTIVP
jgi:hypothetical protein